jgi:DNA-binding transcriptional MerR regulator
LFGKQEAAMFLTGEFSKIAHVSKRMLQYYDEIGLLKPERIDPKTGYRYYSAKQLPRLNRILALKDLGLSLDQIARMLDNAVSDDEIHGMLLMQKAELEQQLLADLQRFRRIESRLQQQHEAQALPDVVLKSAPAQPYLSMRATYDSVQTATHAIVGMMQTLPERVGRRSLSHFTVVVHADSYDDEDFDVEFGFLLTGEVQQQVVLDEQRQFSVKQLPAVETMATYVHLGGPSISSIGYGVLGEWIEANGYRIIGPQREVFLEFPLPKREEDIVIEIQFPVEKLASNALLSSVP